MSRTPSAARQPRRSAPEHGGARRRTAGHTAQAALRSRQ